MASFKTAVRHGISPVEFWQLTPFLTRIAINSSHENMLIETWHVAAFSRQKKLPKLQKLLQLDKSASNLKNALSGIGVKKDGS